MEEKALEILKRFNDNGYDAYIVGGYVRDVVLGIKSNDIDICTSATPKEILSLFDNVILSDMKYGSVIISYKGYKYDVTTFRKEIKYENNRKPVKIKYIKNIKKDLKRRDFTVNTLCINYRNEVIDFLGVEGDIDKKILRTVGSPRRKIKEDSLRILRCIRFATILGFDIDKKTKRYLTKYSYLLKNLSMNRKKEELDKIFLSKNKERGRNLIIELSLCNSLDINNLPNINLCTDLIGIWSQLNVDDIYPFSKLEREEMNKIRELLLKNDIDNYTLYKYGLYLCTVWADIKGISKRKINTMYANLPINSSKDIVLKPYDISKILKRKPGSYINDIFSDIEEKIINNELSNDYDEIKDYILKNGIINN